MSRDEEGLPDIELRAPAIRHELLLLPGDQKGREMKIPEGRVVKELCGKEAVDDLFFTCFFIH